MDRIELATQLISKGVELLDEVSSLDYYAKKGEKQINDYMDEKNRFERRYKDGYLPGAKSEKNIFSKKRKDDINRLDKTTELLRRERKNREGTENEANVYSKNKFDNSIYYAMDAANRHMRRHSSKSQNETVADLLTEAAYLLDNKIKEKDLKKSYNLYKSGIHIEINSKKEFMKLVNKYMEDALKSCFYTQFDFIEFNDKSKLSYDDFKKNFKNISSPRYEDDSEGFMTYFLFKYLDSKNTGDGSYKREIPMEIIFTYSPRTNRFSWAFDGSD